MDWQWIALLSFAALGFVGALLLRKHVARREIVEDVDKVVDERTSAWIQRELKKHQELSDKEALREFEENFGGRE